MGISFLVTRRRSFAFLPMAKIKVSLRQAVATDPPPEGQNLFFESPAAKKQIPEWVSAFW